MKPEQEIKDLKERLRRLESMLTRQGGVIVLNGTVKVKGRLNADRVYTARTGNHVELTT